VRVPERNEVLAELSTDLFVDQAWITQARGVPQLDQDWNDLHLRSLSEGVEGGIRACEMPFTFVRSR
jgi:hypothetical protein